MDNVRLFPGSSTAPLPARGNPSMDVTVQKDARQRRYLIRAGQAAGTWYCQVFFDDTQHRGEIAPDLHTAHRRYAEYRRELAAAAEDGWSHG